MNVKPIVDLADGEMIQHPSGILDKQVSKADLEKNWKQYIFLYPTRYKNSEQLKQALSSQARVKNPLGVNTMVYQSVDQSGAKMPIFTSVKKPQVSNAMRSLLERVQKMNNTATPKTNSRRKR